MGREGDDSEKAPVGRELPSWGQILVSWLRLLLVTISKILDGILNLLRAADRLIKNDRSPWR